MADRETVIREELERILVSAPFAASPMLAAFLRYVVEETLAGRAARLKAYTIAVGALARSEDFDPNENPLVRVQARRLRQALGRHYETTTAGSPLRIDLPLGSYVPVFVEATPEEGGPALPAPPAAEPAVDLVEDVEIEIETLEIEATLPGAPLDEAPPPAGRAGAARRGFPRSLLAAATLLIGVVLGVAAMLWIPADRTAQIPTPPPSIATAPETTAPPAAERRNLDASRVLPLLYVDVETRGGAPAGFDPEIYRNRIESFVQRFDDTVVVTRRSPDFPAPDDQPLYRLRFLVASEAGAAKGYYRLVHAGDERVLKAGPLTLSSDPPTPPPEGVADLAADLVMVRNLIQLGGAIPLDLANLDDLSPELRCLTNAWRFYRELTEPSHLNARTCLETLTEDDPRLTPALTLLGAMYLGEFRQSIDRRPGDPLARAEDLLGRAVRIAPTSSAPYQFLADLLLLKADTSAAIAAGLRSVELNPADIYAIGGFGSLLARIGRYQEALPFLRRALGQTASPPKWLEYYVFLALNNLGRTEEADREVALFDGTRSSLFLTAVAIRAHRRGDAAAAAVAFAEITRAEPDFVRDPRAFLRRRGLADLVIDRLMIDLGRAGLTPAPDR